MLQLIFSIFTTGKRCDSFRSLRNHGETKKGHPVQIVDQLQHAVNVLFPDVAVRDAYIRNPHPDILKKAYRSLAMLLHPDLNGGRTHERFVVVSKAYTVLSDVPPVDLKRVFTQKQPVPRYGRSYHIAPVSSAPVAPSVVSGQERGRTQRRTYQHPPNSRIKQIPKYQPVIEEAYHQGELPQKPLQLGMFLYYTGKVSFQMLAHALAWQREFRPSMGDLAKAWKWLDDMDVDWILKATSIPGRFAERACRMGYLTRHQSNLLLLQQQSIQPQVGQYFIANGVLSPLQLNNAIKDLNKHNMQFAKV